jgi:hypothetical protein
MIIFVSFCKIPAAISQFFFEFLDLMSRELFNNANYAQFLSIMNIKVMMHVFFQLVHVIKMNSPAEMGPAYKVHGDAMVIMIVVTNLMKKDVLRF